jgi:hypothetical protein
METVVASGARMRQMILRSAVTSGEMTRGSRIRTGAGVATGAGEDVVV